MLAIEQYTRRLLRDFYPIVAANRPPATSSDKKGDPRPVVSRRMGLLPREGALVGWPGCEAVMKSTPIKTG